MRRIGFPWSPAMVERSRRSAGRHDRRVPLGAGARLRHQPRRRHASRAPRLRRRLLRVQRRRRRRARDAGRGPRRARADRRPRRAPGRRHRRDRRRRPDDPHALDPRPPQLPVPQGGEPTRRRARRRHGRRPPTSRRCASRSRWPCAAAPDLAIYLAGADPYEGDRLGRLALTKDGPRARATRTCSTRCALPAIPVAIAMAGGYAEDIDDIVDIHFATVAQALCALCRGRRGRRPTPHRRIGSARRRSRGADRRSARRRGAAGTRRLRGRAGEGPSPWRTLGAWSAAISGNHSAGIAHALTPRCPQGRATLSRCQRSTPCCSRAMAPSPRSSSTVPTRSTRSTSR